MSFEMSNQVTIVHKRQYSMNIIIEYFHVDSEQGPLWISKFWVPLLNRSKKMWVHL